MNDEVKNYFKGLGQRKFLVNTSERRIDEAKNYFKVLGWQQFLAIFREERQTRSKVFSKGLVDINCQKTFWKERQKRPKIISQGWVGRNLQKTPKRPFFILLFYIIYRCYISQFPQFSITHLFCASFRQVGCFCLP